MGQVDLLRVHPPATSCCCHSDDMNSTTAANHGCACAGLANKGALEVNVTQDGSFAVVKKLTPQPVAAGYAFSKIFTNWEKVCGLLANGSAYCWGKSNASMLPAA